jgi:hypothetical protein
MDHIYGAELWMLAPGALGGDERSGGLLLIATPTGKHWHWLPLKDYETTDHLQAMALHYIGTLGLHELTVIECAPTEAYLLSQGDVEEDHDQEEDHESPGQGP